MHTFSIKKPNDIKAALSRVSLLIRENGGSFNGDEKLGRFSGNGIDGSYAINDGIQITIIKKPFIYPMQEVESRIREYFKNTQ